MTAAAGAAAAAGGGGGGGGGGRGAKNETYSDNKRKDDVRMANMVAAKSLADAVRTSLGPRGMDKMVRGERPRRAAPRRGPHWARAGRNWVGREDEDSHQAQGPRPALTPAPPPRPRQICSANGEVIITNDGATILSKMEVTQPAAKMLSELSKAQARVWEGRGKRAPARERRAPPRTS